MKKLISFIFLISLVFVDSKSYEGYQVYQTAPLTWESLKLIHDNVLRNSIYQIWNEPKVGLPAQIVACCQHSGKELANLLESMDLRPQLLVDNIERIFQQEREQIDLIRKRDEFSTSRNVTFERFMDYDEISLYLTEVAATYPEIAQLASIGTSYEGRQQNLLKLSNGNGVPKIGIFIDAGIHAAEWLGPSVALNTIFQLTANSSANQVFLDMADWYILPVANPDGYVFSWTEDRLWRKTRRPNEGSDCVGADPNRNFDNHWGEGGETDPCLWNYPGPNVYSEIESKNIADYLLSLKGDLHLYIATHSYGQLLLHPYGYTTSEVPPNYNEMYSAANLTASVLESVRGTEYTFGSSGVVLYLAFGNTQDFAYEAAGARFSYTWELPAGGPNGNDPPATDIKPVVEETWAAYQALIQRVYDTVYPN
ncbi:carboxypeptidase B-like [Neocloeon triangulifer]|uniref:carboxypeptidase B-like n=1 Tax=Neocloeon triangulifer TaxID=2078957 RepID=UPI00286F7E4C|nr:carboxypeptidase B-like [Neocloeon triangulifer]